MRSQISQTDEVSCCHWWWESIVNILAMTSSSGLGKGLLLSSYIPTGLWFHVNTPANIIYHYLYIITLYDTFPK